MNELSFLPPKYHIYMILFLIISGYLSSVFCLTSFILYLFLCFLFRVGKRRSDQCDGNDDILNQFVYAPAFATVKSIVKENTLNVITLNVPIFSLQHSWSIVSLIKGMIKNIEYFRGEKKVTFEINKINFSAQSRLWKPKVVIGLGDKVDSRVIFGYMPFGGIICIELPKNYELLINENDKIERSKTIIAKLK